MQIDSIGTALGQGQISTANSTQEKGTTSLFASMLYSMLSESTQSIGDFSDENSEDAGFTDSTAFLGQGSFLSGMQEQSDGMGNMLALLFAGLLLSGGSMGSELIGALMGTGRQASLYNSDFDTGEAELSADSEPAEENSFIQAGNLLAAAGQYGSNESPIPASSWIPVNPLAVSHVGERDAGTYRAVISQFDVEANERYRVNKQGAGDTYCNIFAWDVSRAMGAEIPHYVNAATGEPAAPGEAGATELDANAVNDWLNTYGKQYGWVEVSAQKAQEYANAGMPAVTTWKNPGGHGHMQVVSPSEDGVYDASRGVAIAQAGRHLYNYNYITSVYGQNTLPEVQYFAHI